MLQGFRNAKATRIFWYSLKIQEVPSLRVSRNVHSTILEIKIIWQKESKALTIFESLQYRHRQPFLCVCVCEVEK